MHNSSESSHVNHVGVAVLLFILGSIVGYYAGAAYEADAQNQSAYDQSYFFGLKKKKAVATPVTKSTTTTPVVATTTDKTADWKTYASSKYGFSFKYPSNNQAPTDEGIGGIAPEESQMLILYLTDNAERANNLTMIRFISAPLSVSDQKLSLADYVKSISSQTYTSTEVKIGSETAVKVNYTSGSYNIKDASGRTINNSSGKDVRFIKHNDNIYMIEPNANATKTGNPNLADQILATFKFTK